jgi:hypothetical protein
VYAQCTKQVNMDMRSLQRHRACEACKGRALCRRTGSSAYKECVHPRSRCLTLAFMMAFGATLS